MNLKNVRVAIVGLAKSGKACAKRLLEEGAIVSIYDKCSFASAVDEILPLISLGITVYCETNVIELEETDLIVVSPGIPPSTPFFKEAREMGIEIISEIELAYRLSPCPIIAVTGTNGKTTTTVMAGKILKEAGIDYFIGGNIAGYQTSISTKGREGLSLIECVDKAIPSSIIAAEISTFQLEECHSFKPKAAALLNVGTDHINRHGSWEVYAALKAKIFAFQDSKDISILNADDSFTASLADKLKSKVYMFSTQTEVENGCYLEDGKIFLKDNKETIEIMDTSLLKVPGKHNIANAMAAILLCLPFNIKTAVIKSALSKFTGVTHRLEFVKTFNDIDYINNSMCTNVQAGISSIYAIEKPQIIICGGKDKGSDFTPFAKAISEKTKYCIIIGADREKIADKLDQINFTSYSNADSLEEAINIANSNAKAGDAVVLTPACASFDMFSSFEDRGNQFKEIINNLI